MSRVSDAGLRASASGDPGPKCHRHYWRRAACRRDKNLVTLLGLMLIVSILGGDGRAAAADDEIAEVDPLEIKFPSPTEPFRVEDLTPEQAGLCAQFRRLAGEYRKPAFAALQRAGAFSIDEKRVTEEHVIAWLGNPDARDGGYLTYSLGFGESAGHALMILLHDGRAAMIGFSRTL